MASQNYTEYTCDLCGKQIRVNIYKDYKNDITWRDIDTNDEIKPWINKEFNAKFVTNQNDGFWSSPYFDVVELDICPECYKKLLENWPIVTKGTQGHNEYTLEK